MGQDDAKVIIKEQDQGPVTIQAVSVLPMCITKLHNLILQGETKVLIEPEPHKPLRQLLYSYHFNPLKPTT